MRRRFKIAFVILLVVTIIWTLAWHQHIVDYKQKDKAFEERYQKWLEEHEENGMVDMLGLGQSIWAYKNGWVWAISGFIIYISWELLLFGVYNDWREGKDAKNEKVGWAVKILVTLASLLIFILYPIALLAPLIFSLL